MLSKKEIVIVTQLRNGARQNLTKISKRTNIPISTIFDKLKKLEERNIVKHTSLIDFEQLGYNTRATIMLKSGKNERYELEKYLLKHEKINSVFKITNGFDFFIEGIFRTIKELEDFLELVEDRFNVKKKNVFFIIKEIKRENFMTNNELIKFELLS
ncbi:MAG: Lrp/AsnC family transcriptional regulator [Candidatus Woesearchaeota archaeon]